METKLDILPVEKWGLFPEGQRPLLIAGPCSAESEVQVMQTARGLKAAGVNVFRAGIWKPRTHPNNFEGIGTPGLKWLQRVKNELGMKVATEVASEKHIFDCLKFGVDMVWIGARTTANPFLVQEIADALKDTDIPVLVKNPVNPDIDLWIGALERLNQAGIKKLGVIHRGFPPARKSSTATFRAGSWRWRCVPGIRRCLSSLTRATWEVRESISMNCHRGHWTLVLMA